MPRNRTLQRLIIHWQNVVSDVKRRIRLSFHRTRGAMSSSATNVSRSLADAPGSAGSRARRAVRSIPVFFAGLLRSLRRTPGAVADLFRGAARQARDVGDTVKTSVKGAQVQAQGADFAESCPTPRLSGSGIPNLSLIFFLRCSH